MWIRPSSYPASAQSRATCTASDTPGMPESPMRADTTPSCITPSPDRHMSSSCRVNSSPVARWYCSARRITRALSTGTPSSDSAAAPASARSPCSVSAPPCCPTVMAGMNPVGTTASCAARCSSDPRMLGLSVGGWVLGMASTVTTPPAAALAVPDAMSSACSLPGVRRCTCTSTMPGITVRPAASTSSRPAASPPITPSRTTRSPTASMPAAGSSSRAPRSTTLAGSPGRWGSRTRGFARAAVVMRPPGRRCRARPPR